MNKRNRYFFAMVLCVASLLMTACGAEQEAVKEETKQTVESTTNTVKEVVQDSMAQSEEEEKPVATEKPLPTIYELQNMETTVNWELVDGVLTFSGEGAVNTKSSYIQKGTEECITYDKLCEELEKVKSTVKKIVLEEGILSYETVVHAGSVEEISLPEGLIYIGNVAFKGSKIKELNLPNSVREIEIGAFRESEELVTLNLSDNLVRIGRAAFRECTGLTELALPCSLRTLESSAFSECDSLRVISGLEYVKEIDSEIFANCDGLETIQIPGNWRNVPPDMFVECVNLKTVIIEEGVKKIGPHAFKDSGLQEIKIPASVKEIGDEAFRNVPCNTEGIFFIVDNVLLDVKCGEEVTIPEGVTRIGSTAFGLRDYNQFKTVIMPDTVTTIDKIAFARCEKLESIRLSANLKSIGNAAFSGCKSLKSITLPESITEYGEDIFINCANLTEIHGKSGTLAEQIAKEYGYTFIAE